METGPLTYMQDPDTRLMMRVKRGDEAAFAVLVRNYQERLVNILFHLVGDQQTAEDLTQEVFLRVYRARLSYEPTARFSTWLFHITHNVAHNSRRSKFRRKEVTLPPQDTGPNPNQSQLLAEKSALMPSRVIDKREMCRIIQAAIDSLNERQKMAVLLHKFEQMSYQDIADTMELTPAAVKSLLARARECLREKLLPFVGRGELPVSLENVSEEEDE
ncbi:MAG: RNA polymerase sigma factor [Planctomycetales bacterium]